VNRSAEREKRVTTMAFGMNQIVGAVVFAIGIVLLGFGFHSSNAPVDQIFSTLTGRYTDQTMWYFILGTAAVVVGGLIFAFGRRAKA